MNYKQNAAIFIPDTQSHLVIAASAINGHFSQVDVDSKVVYKFEKQDVSGTTGEKPNIKTEASGQTEIVHEHNVSTKTVEENTTVVSGSFYKQQRRKRSKQRQRNITVSEDPTRAQPTLEYKKKHRRRTKSSSDSLSYLEDDISAVSSDVASMQMDEAISHESMAKGSVLVIVPSSRTIAASAGKLRSLLGQLTIAEHGAVSKPKVGIRRLLKSNHVVISHLPAVINSIKAKSLSIKDTSLFVFTDISYSDDTFTIMPNRMENGPTIIMIFKEFPYRSDFCSLESILQYVKTKLSVPSILSVSDHKLDLLRILYPEMAYSLKTMTNVDMMEIVCTLRGHISTTFGTYGELHGKCLFI